jgi:hypothetical protein
MDTLLQHRRGRAGQNHGEGRLARGDRRQVAQLPDVHLEPLSLVLDGEARGCESGEILAGQFFDHGAGAEQGRIINIQTGSS